MKWTELLIVGIVHVCAALLTLAVMPWLNLGEHLDTAPVVAAIAATQAAGWLYHRRDHEPAPMGARLIVGALLAGLCLAEASCFRTAGIISEASNMPVPIIAAGGTFVMALLLFGTMRRAFARSPAPAPLSLSRRATALVILPTLVIASACAIAFSVCARMLPYRLSGADASRPAVSMLSLPSAPPR